MLPKALATKSENQRRKKALETMRTTSHWACIAFKMNGEFPRDYGAGKVWNNYPPEKVKTPRLTLSMILLALIDESEWVNVTSLRVKPAPKVKDSTEKKRSHVDCELEIELEGAGIKKKK